MSESRNVQVVKDAYAAFQRGDINGVIALVDEAVDWHALKGAEGVAQLAGSTEFTRFEPREFVAQGDQVVAIGDYAANIKTTGRSVASEWVMVFTLRDGKVTRFREWTDSAQLVKAYGAAAPA